MPDDEGGVGDDARRSPRDARDALSEPTQDASGGPFAGGLGGELPPGARVGRYVILKKVGAGGMGTVYAAYDEQLDRRVALKVLSSSLRESAGSGAAGRRLLREAQAIAKLSHPNVIAAFDVGTFGDQVFLAMEYVDGETLRAWREAAPRTAPAIVAIYVQAGRGLEAAHAAGILHRDFKPENVVVDGKGRARVLDFGLARIDTPLSSDDGALDATETALKVPGLPLTRYGALVGTPAYMAPEQLRGEWADTKSDQFSFCVALYEALYRERPRTGGTVAELLESSQDNVVNARSTGADVPRSIRQAVLRGLRADPKDRFPGMGELLAALEGAFPSRGKSAARVSVALGAAAIALAATSFALARRVHSNRCEGAEKLLAGAWDDDVRGRMRGAFAAASPGSDRIASSVERSLDAYAAAWVKMRTESCVATRVREEQSEQVIVLRTACLDARLRELHAFTSELTSRADAPRVLKAPQAAAELTSLAPCADVAGLTGVASLPTDPSALARVREGEAALSEAAAVQSLGEDSKASELAARALSAAVAAGFVPLEAKARYERGASLAALADNKAADAELSTAFAQSLEARDDALATRVATTLAHVEGVELARAGDGLRWIEIGHATLLRAGNDEGLRADLLRVEARVHYEEGDGKGAVTFAEAALASAERLYGKDGFRVTLFLDALGAAYSRHQRHEDARDAFARELAIARREVGDEHPRVAASLANLGIEEDELYDYAQGRAHLAQAVDLLTRIRGPKHEDTALALSALGSALNGLGKWDEAVATMERAVAINDAIFGPDYGDTTAFLTELGRSQAQAGDLTGALATLERGYALAKKANVDPIQGGDARFGLAQALARKDAASRRARDVAREAEATFQKGEDASKVSEVRRWIEEHP
jgi:tetratricopeptide (TPR) repeat protein